MFEYFSDFILNLKCRTDFSKKVRSGDKYEEKIELWSKIW